jgi:hypothetical protein
MVGLTKYSVWGIARFAAAKARGMVHRDVLGSLPQTSIRKTCIMRRFCSETHGLRLRNRLEERSPSRKTPSRLFGG